jgi:hypothetical protein
VVHPDDREALIHPQPLWAPFEIPASIPAVELAEGGEIRFGSIRLRVLHTPGQTPGSVCLQGGPFRACCLTLGTARKFLILRAFLAYPRLRAPPHPREEFC